MADLPDCEVGHLPFFKGAPLTMEPESPGCLHGDTPERLLRREPKKNTPEVHCGKEGVQGGGPRVQICGHGHGYTGLPEASHRRRLVVLKEIEGSGEKDGHGPPLGHGLNATG